MRKILRVRRTRIQLGPSDGAARLRYDTAHGWNSADQDTGRKANLSRSAVPYKTQPTLVKLAKNVCALHMESLVDGH